MCTICFATTTFDPNRHVEDTGGNSPLWANVNEGSDAAEGTSTVYEINVGDTFTGSINGVGDYDWVAIDLTAGQTVNIQQFGSGANAMEDPYLRLYDASGTFVVGNDDAGGSRDSEVLFTASTSGTYYIEAGGYYSSSTGYYSQGDYTISVTSEATPEPQAPGTFEELADFLTDGYWEFNGLQGRSFNTAGSNEISVNITNLTSDGQQLARWAFEAWQAVANLTFVETTGSADITFDDNDSGAYSTSVTSSGVIASSFVNVSTNWLTSYGSNIDDYSFSTYIHEIGHALGLGHQGNYNGSATYGQDEAFSNDSYQVSIMSYFSQTDNTALTASYAEPLTAMIADIIAIQNLYGAPDASSQTAGDTIWGEGSNLGGYMEIYFDAVASNDTSGDYGGNPLTFTIYDRDGTDTADLSFMTTDDRINMSDGTFSDVGGLIGNVAIAQGTVLENLVSGSGSDLIFGNEASNSITSGSGADTVYAGAGADTLSGGAGADELWAGAGDDQIDGGAGADFLAGLDGDDQLTSGTGDFDDTIWAGSGSDTLTGGDGDDLLWGGTGDNSISGGAGNDTLGALGGDDSLEGGAGNDIMYGSDGADLISGGTGDDTLWSGAGADTLTGGADADTFYFASGADNLTDFDTSEDTLYFGEWLFDNSVTTGADIIAAFGAVTSGNAVIELGSGNSVMFDNLTSLTGLADAIEIY